MANGIYLVFGNDVEGENQDAFVIAGDPAEAEKLWNKWCVDNEFPRDWNDNHNIRKIYPARQVREILPDVTGTKFHGSSPRYLEWDEVPVVK